jgi:hypothetical protein
MVVISGDVPPTSFTVALDGTVILVRGWVFQNGNQPKFKANRISAGAFGSRMFVYSDPNNPDNERVFIMGDTKGFAMIGQDAATTVTWSDPTRYAQYDPAGGLSLKSFDRDDPNDPIGVFYNSVLQTVS